MNKNAVEFERTDKGLKELAIFLAQLTREGIIFSVRSDEVAYRVAIMGY